jgi:hypothetical protein
LNADYGRHNNKKGLLRMITRIGTSIACLAACTVVAGPLQRNQIDADAVWMVHLDVDKLKQTAIGRHVLEEMYQPEAQNKLAAFEAIFSFDPRRDVTGVTLYGTGTRPEQGVMLLHGSFDTQRLVTLAKAGIDYVATEHRNHVIHAWTDRCRAKAGRKDARAFGAVHGSSVVLGQKHEAIASALDVLDNLTANLGSTGYFLDVSSTGFLQAATRKVEVPDAQPHSAMLRQAQYLSLTAGETAGQFQLNVFAQAASAEAAQSMHQVGQGLLALAALQTDRPEAVQFARAIQLAQSGDHLTASLTLPATDVIAEMKRKAAAKEANEQ